MTKHPQSQTNRYARLRRASLSITPQACVPGEDACAPATLDQDFVGLFHCGTGKTQPPVEHFEVLADRRAITNAFGQAFGVGQNVDGAQSLRIAFQEDSLTGIRSKRGRNYFLAKSQLNEIEFRFKLGGL